MDSDFWTFNTTVTEALNIFGPYPKRFMRSLPVTKEKDCTYRTRADQYRLQKDEEEEEEKEEKECTATFSPSSLSGPAWARRRIPSR